MYGRLAGALVPHNAKEYFVSLAGWPLALVQCCWLRLYGFPWQEAERRHQDEWLEELLFKQAVAANLAAKDKDDEWRRIRKEQREKFIDFVNSDEED
ncbi:ABC transporter B family member 25 [Hordeum vulgare]|nr:ABC transporter B family member 25 [Hordeum vulgare]